MCAHVLSSLTSTASVAWLTKRRQKTGQEAQLLAGLVSVVIESVQPLVRHWSPTQLGDGRRVVRRAVLAVLPAVTPVLVLGAGASAGAAMRVLSQQA